MAEKKEHIYEDEQQQLDHAKKVLKDSKSSSEAIKKEFTALTEHFEELLNNTILITSISDRFQEKYKNVNEQLMSQAEAISKANLQLETDNRALRINLKNLNKEAAFIQAVDYDYFQSIFPDKTACLDYLSEIKWDSEYACRKCGNEKFCNGNSFLARRCTRCRYDESATAFTLFHKCKFPITKALYMTILIHHYRDEISSYELGRRLDLRQKTCWSFRKKVLTVIDEIEIGQDRTMKSWMKLILHV